MAQGGPKVANALASGSGKSPHLPPDKTHHQDHVRPGDGLRHCEKIGEFLICHPAMGDDDKVVDIRQDGREAAKADRRDQRKMRGQRDRGRRVAHRALAFSMPATAMLSGTRPNRTTRSGRLPKGMRPKASAAKSTAPGGGDAASAALSRSRSEARPPPPQSHREYSGEPSGEHIEGIRRQARSRPPTG